ncbi:46222_t:CDS:2, partial [Gigaspora margarita]
EVRTSNISKNTWQMLQQWHLQFFIRPVIDIMLNTTHIDPLTFDQMFKSKTNLPSYVRLQPDAYIIYLNNSLITQEICNSTIGIITNVNPTDQFVRIVFSVRGSIVNIEIYKNTYYFEINENNCHHIQFSLQNCFALTVHKTQ